MNNDKIASNYEQPMTDNSSVDLIWRVHYQNGSGGVSYIYAYCKSQEEAKALFEKDLLKNWDGDLSGYKFLYAEILGECIFSDAIETFLKD